MGDVADAVGGRLIGPLAPGTGAGEVRGVSIDSRSVAPGDLFVALPGTRVDGHDFVEAAFAGGAAAAMVAADRMDALRNTPGTLVVVADPGAALLRLAAAERAGATATVVGITGSTGKTSTKDFAGAVLETTLRTVRSPASFNNEIGLPLTILSAPPDTQALVLEMGARGPGQIRALCDIARPSIGVVTNVGVAHMELFGSREAIRDAKAELPEALPARGVAILNADDPVVLAFAERTPARSVLFGLGDADVAATDVALDPATGCASFTLRTPSGEGRVGLRAPGAHMVPNALAAAAVGHAMGVPFEAIAGALGEAVVSAGRMEVLSAPMGVRVVNDAYNANPTSMAAALRAARAMAGAGRCIAVLGGMAELGAIGPAEHERVGELVVRLGVDDLVAVGPSAAVIAASAEREGMEPDHIVRASGADEALDAVRSLVRTGDLVLVKASRVDGLDRVARALASSAANGAARSAGTGAAL
jgi:UDP-N-acetylmuramoyl-tripeptide--D-alanyl-D-alanine ligase